MTYPNVERPRSYHQIVDLSPVRLTALIRSVGNSVTRDLAVEKTYAWHDIVALVKAQRSKI